MNLWQEVITTAVVGTQRKTLNLPLPTNQLGELLNRLDTSDLEGTILSAAAAISLYQKAGKIPVRDLTLLPNACETEDLPRCSARAGEHLAMILSGQHGESLAEWLTAAAAARQRAPERLLVQLLDAGRQRRYLQEAILPVLGKRGCWLAAQNPDWKYVAGEDDETTWLCGDRSARQLLLKKLRASNPASAREKIAMIWDKEVAEDRAAFLKIFKVNLSIDDEPFLENALDDRSKEVRRPAADLLAHLSESRLCQRTIKRLQFLLAFAPLPKLQIVVNLPQTCDKEMIRDGIDSNPPSGIGDKAWWLLQMLAIVPPNYWCQTSGLAPKELIQIALGNTYERSLIEGWMRATLRHRDVDWADALLNIWPKQLDPETIKGLMEVLPVERGEAFILELLQSNRQPLRQNQPALSLLKEYQKPWSIKLSRAVLAAVRSHIMNSDRQNPDLSLRWDLKQFAYYMSPQLAREASAILTPALQDKSYWVEAMDEFLLVLNFRNDMLKQF